MHSSRSNTAGPIPLRQASQHRRESANTTLAPPHAHRRRSEGAFTPTADSPPSNPSSASDP